MFVVGVDMLLIWPTKETFVKNFLSVGMTTTRYERERGRGKVDGTYLCDLDIVNLELCVWVRLLGVEHLLYGDWSEGVFAICSLSSRSVEGRRRMGQGW